MAISGPARKARPAFRRGGEGHRRPATVRLGAVPGAVNPGRVARHTAHAVPGDRDAEAVKLASLHYDCSGGRRVIGRDGVGCGRGGTRGVSDGRTSSHACIHLHPQGEACRRAGSQAGVRTAHIPRAAHHGDHTAPAGRRGEGLEGGLSRNRIIQCGIGGRARAIVRDRDRIGYNSARGDGVGRIHLRKREIGSCTSAVGELRGVVGRIGRRRGDEFPRRYRRRKWCGEASIAAAIGRHCLRAEEALAFAMAGRITGRVSEKLQPKGRVWRTVERPLEGRAAAGAGCRR